MSDREERRAEQVRLFEEQKKKDEESIEDLEFEHGPLAVIGVHFRKGLVTRAAFRAPSSGEYNRLVDVINRSAVSKKIADIVQAKLRMASACWVYPLVEEERKALLEAVPGLLLNASGKVSELAEGQAVEEGKG
jgi:hypothetical protein